MTAIHRALEIIDGDRNEQYGEPERNLGAIAGMWTIYLMRKGTTTLTAEDVANMMALLKITREAHRHSDDNFVDAIGYLELSARQFGGEDDE